MRQDRHTHLDLRTFQPEKRVGEDGIFNKRMANRAVMIQATAAWRWPPHGGLHQCHTGCRVDSEMSSKAAASNVNKIQAHRCIANHDCSNSQWSAGLGKVQSPLSVGGRVNFSNSAPDGRGFGSGIHEFIVCQP